MWFSNRVRLGTCPLIGSLSRRLRERHLKSEFALPRTLSRLIRQMLANFFGILKDSIKVQGKEKKVVVLFSGPRQDVKFVTFMS